MKHFAKNSFFALIKFIKVSSLKYIIGLFGSAMITLFIQIVMAKFFKDMFNSFVEKDLHSMFSAILFFGVIAFILFMISPIFTYLTNSAIVQIIGSIRRELFSHIQYLPISYFTDGHSGELISKLTNDVSEIEKAYAQIFTKFSRQIITGIGTIIYMFYLEWRLAFFVIVTALFSIWVNKHYSKSLRTLGFTIQECLGDLTKKFSDSLSGSSIIRLFNLQQTIASKIKEKTSALYVLSSERIQKNSTLGFLNNFLFRVSVMGMTAMGAYMVVKGLIPVGIIVAVGQLQNGVSDFVNATGSIISELQGPLAAVDRVSGILSECKEPETYFCKTEANNNEAIAFDNVVFSYDKKENVCNHMDFFIPRGKTCALVGASGSGKTTVTKLLLGFYSVDSGTVVVEGKPLNTQKLNELREKIAYVPQNAHLFSGTIAENIGYGKRAATIEEIINAAKIANAHDFIMSLEHGYDTMVGEKGAFLSGGQRQRIAIARAIIKNAPILILDEATSALDSESEFLVQDTLNKLKGSRTTLIVAHRLTTVRSVDQIFVLNSGTVIEAGTHDELIKIDDGYYKRLYEGECA